MTIIDADSVPPGSRVTADVCIVGSGAAGIPMALTLAERGMTVVLLESGYMHEHRRTQALYAGEVADEKMHSPSDRYRQRRFGGSTPIWGGRCVPFDAIDFEQRSYVPDSGWPISYADLAPHYPLANEWAEAGRFVYDADELFGAGVKPMIQGFSSPLVCTNSLERFSCPTNFGLRYLARLRRAPQLRVMLGANCTGIRLQTGGRAVSHLDVATLAGNKFQIVADAHVLAAGGLETARLLLASRDVAANGIGNDHDVVGRYYQCHIAGSVGLLTVAGTPGRVRHGYEVAPDGVYCRRRLSVSAAEQRRLGLTNMVARLHFSRITDPAHRNGVLSTLFFAKRLISYEYGKRLNDGSAATLSTYVRHMRNVVADPLDTAAFFAHWLTRRTFAQRKFPSVILRNRTNRFSLEVHAEQIPKASSRVQLTDSRDELGMPRLRIDWRYDAADIASARSTLDLFAAEFARSGVGRFEYDRERLEEDLMRFGAFGGHHIGTARMGSDVRTSVIDANCQLHSVANLFVAGSAAFATSSQANPTLTIIALALRLADRIAARIGQRQATAA
jgi:choline dehydrogenase-like flavoprotein